MPAAAALDCVPAAEAAGVREEYVPNSWSSGPVPKLVFLRTQEANVDHEQLEWDAQQDQGPPVQMMVIVLEGTREPWKGVAAMAMDAAETHNARST